MNRPLLATCAVVVASATMLTACAGTDSPADDVIHIGFPSAPGNISAIAQPGYAVHWLSTFGYDTLVATTDDGQIVSNLADEWSFDGTVATFHLNDAVTCSDGSAMDAQVVANNFQWHIDNADISAKLGPGLAGSSDFTVAADTDANTVTVTLARPNSSFLHHLGFLPMVCQAGLDDPDQLQTTMIGTGPYVLTDLQQDVSYTFERREDYTWGADGASNEQAPEHIVIDIVDASTAANQFLSGELDLIQVLAGQQYDRVTATGDFAIAESSRLNGLLLFNEYDGRPTTDAGLRGALVQAIDRDVLMQIMNSGANPDSYHRATGLAQVTPMMCPANPSVADAEPAFDVQAANDALDALGYTLDSQGNRIAPDGTPLTLTILSVAENAPMQAASEYIVEQWAQLGIPTSISANTAPANEEIARSGEGWDIAWVGAGYSIPSQWMPWLTETPLNVSHVNETEYAATALEALAAPDTESACALWSEAESALWHHSHGIAVSQSSAYWIGNGVQTDGQLTPETMEVITE